MITNIPEPSEYNILGIEWLLQALGIVIDEYEYEQYREDYNDEKGENEEEDDDNKYINLLNTKLYTAKFLLFQSIECFLRRKIGLKSMFLLIDTDKENKLPTLTDSGEKSFNDIYAHPPEILLRIYSGIYTSNTKLENLFRALKESRNKIVHSLYRDEITIKELCVQILNISKIYDINLRETLKEKHYYTTGIEYTFYSHLLEILQDNLNNTQIKAIFGPGKFGGRCGDDECGDNEDSRTIFFKPKAKIGECVCCRKKYKVVNEECDEKGCSSKFKYQGDDGVSTCFNCHQ